MLSNDSCLILLTYKGKVLLLQNDDILNQLPDNSWRFIEKFKTNDKSGEQTIIQEVERETKVKLDSVTLILNQLQGDRREYIFHANLTDENVNSIIRSEGRILQFFSFQELKKLQLQASIQSLLLNYHAMIEQLPIQ